MLHGIEMTDDSGRRYIPESFTYSIQFNDLTGAWSSKSGQVQIQADAAFVILEQNFTFQDNADPVAENSNILVPNATVLLTDSGSARQLMNQATPISSLFGDGRLPFILPSPKFLSPSSAFQVQVYNPNAVSYGGNTYTLTLSFIGEKRYYLGS